MKDMGDCEKWRRRLFRLCVSKEATVLKRALSCNEVYFLRPVNVSPV